MNALKTVGFVIGIILLGVIAYLLLARPDQCEKSELVSVEGCSASHNGTECINLYKNGKYSFGAGGVVGQKYCTKGLEVYKP